MLEKVKGINYSPISGKVQYESSELVFQEGENTAVLQLRGELDNSIKVVLRIQTAGGKLQEVEGKPVSYKSIAREFKLPTAQAGIHRCQIIMSYSWETNVSEIFQYEVKESLK